MPLSMEMWPALREVGRRGGIGACCRSRLPCRSGTIHTLWPCKPCFSAHILSCLVYVHLVPHSRCTHYHFLACLRLRVLCLCLLPLMNTLSPNTKYHLCAQCLFLCPAAWKMRNRCQIQAILNINDNPHVTTHALASSVSLVSFVLSQDNSKLQIAFTAAGHCITVWMHSIEARKVSTTSLRPCPCLAMWEHGSVWVAWRHNEHWAADKVGGNHTQRYQLAQISEYARHHACPQKHPDSGNGTRPSRAGSSTIQHHL